MNQNESSEIAQRKQHVLKIFDGAAPIYGQVGPPFFSYYGRRLVEIAQIPNGSQVLDVATGRGAVLFPAAESVGPHGKVTGIDFSKMMVNETKKELAQLKVSSNIEVVQMDAENLKFPDGLFDYVVCGFAIFFFPQPYQALAEFRRVLKPGSFICFSTFDKAFSDEWTWLYDIADTYLPSDPEPDEDTDSNSEPGPIFNTPEGLEAIMNTAGLENIQIFTETVDFIYATEEEFWSSIWSHGFRGTLERIEKETGEDGMERFKSEVFNKMKAIKKSDGLHQLIPAHITLAVNPED